MSVLIRKLTESDIPAAMMLTVAERWNQTADDWRRLLGACPNGCFAACDGPEIVGTVSTIVYEDRIGWIGMLIVRSEVRRAGVGRSLLERAITYCAEQRVSCTKLDATPAGRPLYEKLGFVAEYEVQRWSLTRDPIKFDVPLGCWNESIESILSLDAPSFGADRGHVLKSVAAADPRFVLMERDSSGLAGFTLGRRGTNSDHIGPCVARDPKIARRLLVRFLTRSSRARVTLDCVQPNAWMPALLEDLGFSLDRCLTRMYLGANVYPGKPEQWCATLGPEFG